MTQTPQAAWGVGRYQAAPTESEIRDAAKLLGLADANGNYRQRDRNRIAAAVQRAKAEAAESADPSNGTTARQLGQLATELDVAGPFTGETTTKVLVEAARHLLETQGLRLESPREETTP